MAIGADAAVLWPYPDIVNNGERKASCPTDRSLTVMIDREAVDNANAAASRKPPP